MARSLPRPASLLAGAAHDLLTTIFPGDCRVCSEPLSRAGALPICPACLHGLQPRPDAGCRRCGDLLPLADMEDLRFRGMECLSCRLAPPPFTRAVAFGDYEDTLRELIHLLKYRRMPALAKTLGAHLAQAILCLRHEAARDLLVVAVPLHTRTERARGYNQSRLLADAATKALRQLSPEWRLQPAHELLVRWRVTAQQFELSARGRRRNLQGAFAAAEGCAERVKEREVLLIDDILTTGATARECARILLRAGAATVWVATVARACGADRPRRIQVEDTVARWGAA